jgi:hypothetical protein
MDYMFIDVAWTNATTPHSQMPQVLWALGPSCGSETDRPRTCTASHTDEEQMALMREMGVAECLESSSCTCCPLCGHSAIINTLLFDNRQHV